MFSATVQRKDNTLEDRITSSVFDTLLLLPDESFWEILRSSCYCGEKMDVATGGLLSYEFWPRWDAQNTQNQSHVEPDLFIEFENFNVIVEAKMKNAPQNRTQWETEIKAYRNEYAENKKPIYLIALDGIMDSEENENIEFDSYGEVYVFKSRWRNILDVCACYLKKEQDISANNHKKRLLNMVVSYLHFYGILKFIWLSEIADRNFCGINYDNNVMLIKKIGCNMGSNRTAFLQGGILCSTVIDYNANVNIVRKIGG